jgi:hypothetical protein
VAYGTHHNFIYYEFDPLVCSDSQLILRLRIILALDDKSVMRKASAYGKLCRKTSGRAPKPQAGLEQAILLFEWSKAIGDLDRTVIVSSFIAVLFVNLTVSLST